MEEYNNLDEDISENVEVDLTWEDVRCTVKTPTGEKQILKGVSGHAFHGDFLVIMGSSGAGKTTLLNILSKRLKSSKKIKVSGSVLANHQPLDIINFAHYSGYVTQEDLLIPTMTVFETLLFVARLKTTYPNKVQKVNDLIKELNLEDCKNTLVGNDYIKGVSGGEKKRTSIGVELITNPSILFLDEPTSGLDSYTAHIVCALLLEKAKEGKTIISTIHQPNSDIFNLFDKFMLMADGQIVYYGLASESTKFFADHGLICPPLDNPADYYMEVLHIRDSSKLSEEESSLIQTLSSAYKKALIIPEPSRGILTSKRDFKSSFQEQVFYLTQREFLRMFRNPIILLVRFLTLIEMIFLLTVIYRDSGNPSNNAEFATSASVIYGFTAPTFILNLLTTILTFPSQLPIFEKEYQSNLYGIFAYNISVNIIDFLTDIIVTGILVSSTYWVIGFNTSSKAIFYFYFISFLNFSTGSGIGNLTGSIFSDPGLAVVLTSVPLTVIMNFSGFLRGADIPSSFKWIEYTSCMFYSFQALMKTQFEDETYTCECEPGKDCPCGPLDLYNITVDLAISVSLLISMALFARIGAFGVNLYKAKKLKPNN